MRKIEEELRHLKEDDLFDQALDCLGLGQIRIESLLRDDLKLSGEDIYELTNWMRATRRNIEDVHIPRTVPSMAATPKRRQTVNASLKKGLDQSDRFLRALSLDVEDSTLPTLPPGQGPGPHFNIDGGQISFAGRGAFDPNKNNVRRLEALLPVLQSETAKAVSVFARNLVHANIHDALVRYSGSISGTLDSLNYELVAAYGILLTNAELAAKRTIEDRLTPPLEDEQFSSLRSVLDLHGPFILSTEAGRSLIEDTISFSRTDVQEREFKASAKELADAIAEEGIAKPAAGEFLVEAAHSIALGPHPDRSTAMGGNAVRNAVIALVGGALVSFPLAVGWAAPMTAWLAAVIVGEGVKKSSYGQGAVEAIRDALDDPTQKRNFVRLGVFALKHEAVLRRLAGERREFSWVHGWLDWMKEQVSSKKDNG
ncbi:MAG: hypothetical protein V7774_00695 [Pseudorhizobium pelagicum]|uniref:hypothetical protein n=1 Tax=Pseudorhizobium pelagicum TaxID=1509405 RepID=UPI0034610577